MKIQTQLSNRHRSPPITLIQTNSVIYGFHMTKTTRSCWIDRPKYKNLPS